MITIEFLKKIPHLQSFLKIIVLKQKRCKIKIVSKFKERKTMKVVPNASTNQATEKYGAYTIKSLAWRNLR